MNIPIVKAFWGQNFQSPINNWLKIAFWGEMVSKCKCFLDPERHILVRNDVISRTDRANRYRGLGCRRKEEPKKLAESLMLIFAYFGDEKGVIV